MITQFIHMQNLTQNVTMTQGAVILSHKFDKLHTICENMEVTLQ